MPDMTKLKYEGRENGWDEGLSCVQLNVPNMEIPFEAQIEHFVRAIKREETNSCDGNERLRAFTVCEAIRRSIKEKRPIEISMQSEA